MANRIDIEVTGCKGCPFAHYWNSEYGRDCCIHDDDPVDAFAQVDGRSPGWCPLRENSVRLDLVGPRG